MLQNKDLLQNRKNLLAFSAGVDSTALLFLLLENKIPFDIAIVDYGVREESKEELAYAQTLAKRYNFTCYTHQSHSIKKNFEATARTVRYDFFEKLIVRHQYQNLLTAHHLGDRFEWMLMQFCKGSGCVSLSGMKAVEKRNHYKLIRPLLHLDKSELLHYLDRQKHHYFLDATNQDEKYKRNEFRHKHTVPLLEKYLNGIKKSFEYIDEDVSDLIKEIELKECNDLTYFKRVHDSRSEVSVIDRYFKSQGKVLSAHERELLRDETSVVIGRKFIVSKTATYTFIAPFIKQTKMSKVFKEKMRLLKVDSKLRGYLASDEEAVALVSLLLQ